MEDARAAFVRCAALWASVALAVALPASGEVDLGGWKLSGTAELGGRIVTGDDWGSAKYEEYREQDPGVFGGGKFLLEDDSEKYYYRGWLQDVGEDDQRFRLETGRWGQYRLELAFSELPHVYSNQAASQFAPGFDEVLSFTPGPPGRVPLEFRLRTGSASLLYRPRAEGWQDWELSADYEIQDRQGTRPYGINFGFGSAMSAPIINLARPIDERIHEVNLAARYGREAWNVEVGYTGSFFHNDLQRLEVDTDGVIGRDGQISLAPDNSAHTIRLSGATRLPTGFPARLAASFAYSERRQDDDFLCHTVNTAIDPRGGANVNRCPYVGTADPLDLPDGGLDGEVDTFLANLVLTARPHRRVNLTARYRLYDYDNDTPSLVFPARVSYDSSLVAGEPIRSVPNEYQRQSASLDGSYRLFGGLTLRTRYEWEQWNRSSDRSVTRLDEHGGRVALDYRAGPRLQLRTSYELAVRRGNGYEPFARLNELHVTPLTPSEQSEEVFPLLRKRDQADRITDRVDVLALLAPREDLTFTLTGSLTHAEYDNTEYGLLDDERYSLGGEMGYRPLPWLGLSSWYSFEDVKYRQRSRTRNPGPVEGDDWASLTKDQIHALGFRAEVGLVPERLDLDLAYNLQHAASKSRSSGDAAGAENFPGLEDVLQSADATLSYRLREDLTVKTGYRWERYDLKNFKIEDLTAGELGVDNPVFLGERIDDYTAHILSLGLQWSF